MTGRFGKEGRMPPLLDHEQRMLDQIESALYAEDPKFASSVRGTLADSLHPQATTGCRALPPRTGDAGVVRPSRPP